MNPNHHDDIKRIYTEHRDAAAKVIADRHNRHPDDPAIQDAIHAATDRLLRHLQRGGPLNRDTEQGWLIVVAGREFLRPFTKAESRLTTPIDHVLEGTVALPGPTPEQTTIRHATQDGLQRALDRALSRLSPLQRAAITGRARDLTYDQIAEDLGVSRGAVNKALTRARTRLRTDDQLKAEIRAWRD